ncbi:hypothetical protein [Nostoc sp.]|uniref:hypothetical protein n=1 Tax=Nostoc sp. TaxID=1180 RepID=UPI002FF7C6AE
MTAITSKRLTLEEYLKYDDRTDSQYELVAGELVSIPPESPKNVQISLFLLVNFLKFVPVNRLSAVTVLILVDGFYKETRFTGNTAIASTIFPELQVTAEQVLNAGESNVGDAIS